MILGRLGEPDRRLELCHGAIVLVAIGERYAEHHARTGREPGVTGRGGGHDRLLSHGEGVREAAGDDSQGHERREHDGMRLAAWLVGQERRGALELELRLAVAAEVEQRRRARLNEERSPLGLRAGRELRERLVEQPERAFELPCGVRAHPGAAERLDDIDAAALRRIRHLRPDLERAFEMPQRLGRSVGSGEACGLDGGLERTRQVVRRRPVERQQRAAR